MFPGDNAWGALPQRELVPGYTSFRKFNRSTKNVKRGSQSDKNSLALSLGSTTHSTSLHPTVRESKLVIDCCLAKEVLPGIGFHQPEPKVMVKRCSRLRGHVVRDRPKPVLELCTRGWLRP